MRPVYMLAGGITKFAKVRFINDVYFVKAA
jgi:hypothetical protein